MTDRINGFWVALESDVRVDDAEPLLAAVRMLRGVAAVSPRVTDASDWIATERVRREFLLKLATMLDPGVWHGKQDKP